MKRVLFFLVFFAVVLPAAALAAPLPSADLEASPNQVRPGEPVAFTGALLSGVSPPVILDFGDGRRTLIASAVFSATHAYAKPGSYGASLRTTSGQPFAEAGVEVVADNARLPLGAIYSTTISASPVLAGSVINISLSYRIVTPGFLYEVGFGRQTPAFEVIIDLEDGRGNLVRRSDPSPLNRPDSAAVENAVVQYVVPVDARGAYAVRAYIQAVDRGTVAVGAAAALVIVGNSDAASVPANGLHVAGSLESGHRPQVHDSPINPGISASLQNSAHTIALSGIADPVSNRVDPVFLITSLLPSRLASPDALTSEPKPPAALPTPSESGRTQYADYVGRTLAGMPSILGGFTAMRGADLTLKTAPGWVYHGAAGNTELASGSRFQNARTFEQFGDVIDIGRYWSDTNFIRVVHHGRGDNPGRFLGFPQNLIGPQDADIHAVEASHALAKDVTLVGSAAFSASRIAFVNPPHNTDAADLLGLRFHHDFADALLEYHNYGPFYTPGQGLAARSDRAGLLASAFVPLSKTTKLALFLDREATRSVASTQTLSSAAWSYGDARGNDVAFSLARDRDLTQLVDATTDALNLHYGRSSLDHDFMVGGTFAWARDAADPLGNTVTRTGSAQYYFQRGLQALGLGLSATLTRPENFFVGSAVTESLSDGISFGGSLRKVGLQIGVTNTNTRSSQFASVADDLTGALTYRIARGIRVGLKGERTLHYGRFAPSDYHAGGMRFVLIVDR